VFDLDDTLVKTDAKVKVVSRKTGKVLRELTAEEFNNYVHAPHRELDFDQFDDPEILRQGTFILAVLKKLRQTYRKGIPVAIVTARSSSTLVRDFFLENGIDIHPELVIAISDPNNDFVGSVAEKKLGALKKFHAMGFRNFTFFDDNEDNLRLSKLMENEEGVTVTLIVVEDSVPKKFIE
jgi:FMN phosphatase YigB (HAD superfamily)